MNEDEFLMLSGLKHFCFCKRRWALVHIEQLWSDNALTYEGQYMHERVHDAGASEKRGSLILARGMPVCSQRLGLSGFCDMVELIQDEEGGTPIHGRSGKYRLFPVEYKRGKPDFHHADEWQLCAQAMCLEEMLCTDIPEGAIYYGELRRRKIVALDGALRGNVERAVREMHQLYARRHTPRVKAQRACKSCSLREACQPGLPDKTASARYVTKNLWGDADEAAT